MLVSWKTKYTICANASVTMMKYTPRVRSTSAPTTSASSADAVSAPASSSQPLPGPACGARIAVAYAAMAKYAAWPRLTSPV
ncbi:hypothetical protein D3C72_2070680 [compost metagenome]